jgi:NADH-quinone oxidoreductase subunit L
MTWAQEVMGWLPLVIGAPLMGSLTLFAVGPMLKRWMVTAVALTAVATSAAITAASTLPLWTAATTPGTEGMLSLPMWRFIEVGGAGASFALRLDAYSWLWLGVATIIGGIIHLHASETMAEDPAYSRFMATMNLFVASMATLVLADDLLVLFVGWEAIGLCSFLLIGFWWDQPGTAAAARKAFFTTRIGDVALAIALFILWAACGTTSIPEILHMAPELTGWVATLAAAGVLIGAMGKSGQVPLHVWLPDAMAGPTPVSAMIHGATLVTAGVFLLVRLDPLLEAAPNVRMATLAIGAITLLYGGISALGQTQLKRALAYSTISQVGYMFVAIGAGAPVAAGFHVLTHATFKVLLFLAAGVVIDATHHEQDLRKLGGLHKDMPLVSALFGFGALALAALPVVSSGFWSKDLILVSAWQVSPPVAVLGLLGGFLTAIYAGRLWFLTFGGERRADVHAHGHPGWRALGTLVLLAILAVSASVAELPGFGLLSTLVSWMPPAGGHAAHHEHASLIIEVAIGIASSVATLAGLGLAAVLYRSSAGPQLGVLEQGLFADTIVEWTLKKPFKLVVGRDTPDLLAMVSAFPAWLAVLVGELASQLQTRRLGPVIGVVALGAILLVVAMEVV